MDRAQTPSNPEPSKPPALEGETSLRVRYSECDPMGIAHHASYALWLEIPRTDLLRTSGISYADLERAGILLAVVKLELVYKSPARYDDLLIVDCRVSGGGRARLDHAYQIWHDLDDGRGKSTLLLTATSRIACLGRNGKPRPLPDWLTAKHRAGA